MKIQFASDLHLEFIMNKAYIEKHPLEAKGDILILAGDIVPFNIMHAADSFFDYVSDNFETTYWIPGNHKYYQSDINEKSGSFQEHIRHNVILINNRSIEYKDYKIIFSTLWTAIGDQYANEIKRRMNDFRVIKDDGLSLRPEKYNQLHQDSNSFIMRELKYCDKNVKSIVVTHHVPTLTNHPLKYQGSILNEAFRVELKNFIMEFEPNFWIYGHHHARIRDFQIGKTQLMTNQLGYIDLQEHEGFNRARLVY